MKLVDEDPRPVTPAMGQDKSKETLGGDSLIQYVQAVGTPQHLGPAPMPKRPADGSFRQDRR